LATTTMKQTSTFTMARENLSIAKLVRLLTSLMPVLSNLEVHYVV